MLFTIEKVDGWAKNHNSYFKKMSVANHEKKCFVSENLSWCLVPIWQNRFYKNFPDDRRFLFFRLRTMVLI